MKRRDLLGLCAAAAWAWPAAAGTPSRLRLGAAWRAAAAGSPQHVGIHHLPLQQVIVELDYWRDDLDGLLPRVPKQFDL